MGFEKDAPHAAAGLDYRSQFPSASNLIWLHHAGVSPLCRAAADAMKALADDAVEWASAHYAAWGETCGNLRLSAARLIGASPGEIAVVKNTSEGIATVQMGIDWRRGDRVVAFREEFPANFFPWKLLEARGVQVDWLSIYDPLDRVAAACKGARLLAVSFVNYLTGHRVDLEQMGRICSDNGTLFFVDAIQGLGVFPIDVEAMRIDGLASDGHKWLMGPEGCAILYVRRDRQDEIYPAEFGWTNVAGYQDYASRDLALRPDAGRYECGTLNTIGIYGLQAAIDFVHRVGVEEIGRLVLANSRILAEGLTDLGYDLSRPWEAGTASGIVSFRRDGDEPDEIARRLRRANMHAAVRQGWLRLAPHFYQEESEMRAVLAELRS